MNISLHIFYLGVILGEALFIEYLIRKSTDIIEKLNQKIREMEEGDG